MWRCEVSPKQKKANLKDGNIHTTKLIPRVSPPTLSFLGREDESA